MAASSRPPLLGLPLLIVEGIVEALCPHCTDDTELGAWKTPLFWRGGRCRLLINTRALANLAATCREMYAIVIPFLYHQPQGYSWTRASLFRTLTRRPELARRVKVLILDYDQGGFEFPRDKDDRNFLLELTAQYEWSRNIEHGVSSRDIHELLTSLLVAMCPNLVKLSTGRDYSEGFVLLRPGMLPCLKDIYLFHLDTGMGMDLGELIPLYLAAANPETFSAAMASNVENENLALCNIGDLRLDASCISTGCRN